MNNLPGKLLCHKCMHTSVHVPELINSRVNGALRCGSIGGQASTKESTGDWTQKARLRAQTTRASIQRAQNVGRCGGRMMPVRARPPPPPVRRHKVLIIIVSAAWNVIKCIYGNYRTELGKKGQRFVGGRRKKERLRIQRITSKWPGKQPMENVAKTGG